MDQIKMNRTLHHYGQPIKDTLVLYSKDTSKKAKGIVQW